MRLSLIAASLVERAVPIHLAPPNDGAVAWTDGAAVHVDADAGADPDLAIFVQGALLRAGSLSPSIAMRLVGRPRLAVRYLAIEAPRALGLVAAQMPRRLRGHPALGGVPASSSPAQSLRLASSNRGPNVADPLFGMIRPSLLIRGARQASLATDRHHRRGGADPPDAAAQDDQEAEESTLVKLMANGLGLPSLGDLLRRLLAMTPQPSGEPEDGNAGVELAEGEARQAGRRSRVTLTGTTRAGDAQAGPAGSPNSFRYPEWDRTLGRYRADWTLVTEGLPGNEREQCPAAAPSPPTAAVRRQLARLPLGLQAHRFQRAGDDLVIDDVVRLMVDLQAGRTPDERVYRGMRRTRRDLGVLILVDSSSSARDTAADGRTIQECQVALAWQIADGLHAAGDRIAIYGFNSWGRERVAMARLKGFDDRFGAPVADRLARMTPAGFTRTGAAVRHAGYVIATQSGVPHRLVVLITDGLPYDIEYEFDHAEADTRRAIAELAARQVHCLCLSVGGDTGSEKLKRLFGDSAFMAAERPDEICRQIGPLFRSVLARGFQRRSMRKPGSADSSTSSEPGSSNAGDATSIARWTPSLR